MWTKCAWILHSVPFSKTHQPCRDILKYLSDDIPEKVDYLWIYASNITYISLHLLGDALSFINKQMPTKYSLDSYLWSLTPEKITGWERSTNETKKRAWSQVRTLVNPNLSLRFPFWQNEAFHCPVRSLFFSNGTFQIPLTCALTFTNLQTMHSSYHIETEPMTDGYFQDKPKRVNVGNPSVKCPLISG